MTDQQRKECLKEWFYDPDQKKWYDYPLDQPEQILRLARNIIEHPCLAQRSDGAIGLFMDEADFTGLPAQEKEDRFLQAVADWFCCTYPDLIDLLWDGLAVNQNLALPY